MRWIHLAAWVLLTHPVLDAWTSYGTPLLAPFSWRRFALDGVFIIDFFYSAVLLFAVVLAAGRKVPEKVRRGVAAGALAVSSAYLLVGLGMSFRARSVAVEQLAETRFRPVRVRAVPTLSNIFLWRVVARDEDGGIRAGMVSSILPQRIVFVANSLSCGI